MLSIAKSFISRNKKKRRAVHVWERAPGWGSILFRELWFVLTYSIKIVLFLTIYDTISIHLATNGYPIAGLFAFLMTTFGVLLIANHWKEHLSSLKLAARGHEPAARSTGEDGTQSNDSVMKEFVEPGCVPPGSRESGETISGKYSQYKKLPVCDSARSSHDYYDR
jgi:hypothetical protein